MNLVERLLDQAARHGAEPAIVETRAGAERIATFAQIAERSARAATALALRGVRAGDPVLFLAPMSADLYAWLIGVFRLAAVAMFLDPSAGRAHAARCLRMMAPSAFVGSARAHLLRLAVAELRRVPAAFRLDGWFPFSISTAQAEAAASPGAVLARAAADTPALVTFTSGSTGEPKAVVRSHAFLLAQHAVLQKALALRPGGRDLTTLPIFLLANLASGVTSIIAAGDLRRPGAIDAAPVLAQIRRLAPDSCGSAPAFLERLCDACDESGRTLAPIRRFHVGGGPVFPNLIERAARHLPGGEVIAVYGSSEAEPIAESPASAITPADYARMRGGDGLLAGLPVAEVRVRLLPNRWGEPLGPFDWSAFDRLRLQEGQPGEIVVSGEHVVGGYLRGKGDTETKLEVDGVRWHRTGDLGRFDAAGRLWLLGRCSATLQDSRGVLYPFAVECAAHQVAGVRRAALALIGERRVLAYEGTLGGAEADLRVALAWAALDDVRRVAKIPMDARHNSKVDYPALARLLGAGG